MWIPFGYLIAAVLFILGLKKLSPPRTAPLGFGWLPAWLAGWLAGWDAKKRQNAYT